MMVLTTLAFSLLVGDPTAKLPSWEALQSFYPRLKLANKAPRVTQVGEDKPYSVERIQFYGPDDSVFYGVLVRPKTKEKVPLIVAQHGLGGNKEQLSTQMGSLLAQQGVAMLALDAPEHGQSISPKASMIFEMYMMYKSSKNKDDLVSSVAERDKDGKYLAFFSNIIAGGVQNIRMSLDYVESRGDIDMKRIGYVGFSMGAMMGGVLAPLEPRLKASCLVVGGDPFLKSVGQWEAKVGTKTCYQLCPSLYLPHFNKPLLMANGLKDDIVPKWSTEALFKVASEPKQLKWYDAGHYIGVGPTAESVTWLIKEMNK